MIRITKNNFKVLICSFLISLSFCLTKCHIENLFLKNVLSYSSIITSFFIYFFYIKNRKYSKFIIVFICYILTLFVSTLINNLSLILVLKNYYQILAIIMFFDMIDYRKEYTKYIIKGWYFTFYLLVLINFMTIILYPNGLYIDSIYKTNWFLGYDNIHICFYLSSILFIILKNYYFKTKIKYFDLSCIIMIFFQVFFCFSANSVSSIIIMSILFLLEKEKNILIYIDIIKLYLIILLFNFIFVILRIQNKFDWIITKLLGKKLDFSGRVVIWDRVIQFTSKKKILGYGQEPVNIISSKLGNRAFAHAHNTILDVIYKTGFVGLFFHSFMHCLAIKKLYEMRKYKLSRYISIILFAFIILTIMEARQENTNLYIILSFSYNIKRIIEGAKDNE